MGKTIEIRLSDAQHAALTVEADASGTTFFGYCRAKLLNETNTQAREPVVIERPIAPRHATPKVAAVAPPVVDRIARIEDAVARLTEVVMQGYQPQEQPMAAEPPSVDDIVNAQFAEAEAAGLAEHVPDEADVEMQHSGVRPLQRRPTPFSAANAPKHLQQFLG